MRRFRFALSVLILAAGWAPVVAQTAKQLLFDGYELLQAGKWAEAATKFEQGLAAEPDDAAGHFYLGEAYRGLGQKDKASKEWRKSLELAPDGSVAAQARKRLEELDVAEPSLDETLAFIGQELKDSPISLKYDFEFFSSSGRFSCRTITKVTLSREPSFAGCEVTYSWLRKASIVKTPPVCWSGTSVQPSNSREPFTIVENQTVRINLGKIDLSAILVKKLDFFNAEKNRRSEGYNELVAPGDLFSLEIRRASQGAIVSEDNGTREDRKDYSIWWPDEDTAERVARAVTRAARLCGARKSLF